jgi:Tfp pilus assembly protein PilF
MDDGLRELVALGKEYFQRGDYQLAKGELEKVVSRGASFADVHYMLGVVSHHLGEYPAALRSFERALEVNPDYLEAALNLAIVCNDLGEYDRGQQVYRDALERSHSGQLREANGDEPLDSYTRGKIANLHAAVGNGYLSVNRPNDAAAEFRRALSLCPLFIDLRLKLAHALRDAGDAEGAVDELRVAVSHAPRSVPARVALGAALQAAGNVAEAVVQWEEAVRMDPAQRMARSFLNLASAEKGAAKIPGNPQ